MSERDEAIKLAKLAADLYGGGEGYDPALCDAIAAALKAAREEKWQPIETAPRDGTEVLTLAVVGTVPVVHISWYRDRESWDREGQYCGGWETVEDWLGWWSYTENSVSQSKLEGCEFPTHWMPLPTPPQEQKT